MEWLLLSAVGTLIGMACGIAFAKVPIIGVGLSVATAAFATAMGDFVYTPQGKGLLFAIVVSGVLSWMFAINT